MSHPLTLLAVHAHPDDESISTGGTLARYASEGVRTVLVCATRGEAGEIQDPVMAKEPLREEITALRLRELEKACGVLGVGDLRFLGYRDSGMDGTPANSHPDALCNADPEEATERLVRIIREVRPQVVITYNERGFYGHPDHIAVNRITRSAMEEAANPSFHPEIPWPPWKPEILYYTAVPRSRLLRVRESLEKKGERFDWNIDFLATPDSQIDAWIDVREVLERKFEAIRCHRSQIGSMSLVSRVDPSMREEVFGTECYVCARGCEGKQRRNDELFQTSGPQPPQ